MWKTRWGRCIYRSNNARVYDNGLFRWLIFVSEEKTPPVQTLICKYWPAKAGLYYIPTFCYGALLLPGSTCLLGLGGGGIVHYLKALQKVSQLTLIEYDESVIDIAFRYFNLPKLAVTHQDANDFITTSQSNYRHVLIDLSAASTFPPSCYHLKFFEHCRDRLANDGLLTINLANGDEQKQIFQWIRLIFDKNTVVFPIEKCANMVLYAGSKTAMEPFIDALYRNKRIKTLYWDSVWGRMAH